MWITAIYSLIILDFIDLIDMMFILFPESLNSFFWIQKENSTSNRQANIIFNFAPKRFVLLEDDILDS